MRALDRFIQRWRVAKALPYLREGDRLLDVGAFDDTLIAKARVRVESAVGVDPLASPSESNGVRILRDTFPGETRFPDDQFDCITMLAVLEHVSDKDTLSRECFRVLAPGGRVVITVPRPVVDRILAVLLKLRLISGMSLEEHHDYDVNETPGIFEQAGFRLAKRRGFQLGLNCLFVFEKPST